LSLIPILHPPFNKVYKGEKVVVVCVNPVGGSAALASAINVPVKGTVPVASDTVDAELIFVLVKLSPAPPLAFTRFITLPLGAFNDMVKSASQVWVILKLTTTLETIDPAGMPATVTVLEMVEKSLIGRLIAPELLTLLPGTLDGLLCVAVSCCTVPAQTVALDGVMVIGKQA